MRKAVFLLLAALLALSSCSTALRVSRDPLSSWEGCTTMDILGAMGDPDRIDADGKGGSILVYDSAPGYEDPDYDILDPEASKQVRQYAKFYLDDGGVCYQVDTNRSLPAAPRTGAVRVRSDTWFDWLFIGLLVVGLLL